jgi:hypothetical protein
VGSVGDIELTDFLMFDSDMEPSITIPMRDGKPSGAPMDSQVTLSGLESAGIFFAGFVAGWLIATLRVSGNLRFSLSPPGKVAQFLATKTTRTLELKCACGSIWKFRDKPGPLAPGFQPYPNRDSYSCSKFGKVTDLNEIRKLAGDAMK